MKERLFSRLRNKYSNLKTREKWLLGLALGLILFLFVDWFFISPIANHNEELVLRTKEAVQLLADIRNYAIHKELQKDFFRGKTSDFLTLFMQKAKESQFWPVRLKKTENFSKGILVSFDGDGNIQKILDFILELERMNFIVLFQRANIVFTKGAEYHFEGEILVVRE